MKQERLPIKQPRPTAAVGEMALKCAGCPLAELCRTRQAVPGCEQKAASQQEVRAALQDDSVNVVTAHGGASRTAKKLQEMHRLTALAAEEAKRRAEQQAASQRRASKPAPPPVRRPQPAKKPDKPSFVERFLQEVEQVIRG